VLNFVVKRLVVVGLNPKNSKMDESNEVFEERLSNLKTELVSYGREIILHITTLYTNQVPQARFDLKNDPFNVLKVLQHDVTEVLQQSKQRAEFLTKVKAFISYTLFLLKSFTEYSTQKILMSVLTL
jgi:hypothetical protein